MSSPDPNTDSPMDDLQSALAEIERMSREEAGGLPSLDDGNGDQDTLSVEGRKPVPQGAGAGNAVGGGSDSAADAERQIEDALSQLEAVAAEISAASVADAVDAVDARPAPEPVADDSADGGASDVVAAPAVATGAEPGDESGSGTALSAAAAGADPDESLGTDELQAALEEVETLAANAREVGAEHRASASDASGSASEPKFAKKPAANEPARRKPTDRGNAEAGRGQPRFKIAKSSRDEEVAAYQLPGERGDDAHVADGVPPIMPLGKRLCRTIDRVLVAINRPFADLSDSARATVGLIAVTTLVVSILAMVLLPVVLPHRDAITFLQEKRAALDAPPPPPPSDDADDSDS